MLEIKQITKRYGRRGVLALENVSLTLTEGVYGLLGPNGAGKSTLMGVVTDNLLPDSGEILWDGTPTAKLGRRYRALLGYAPQQQGLYDTFTGRRFLSYMGTLKALPKDALREEIARTAAAVHLEDVLDRPIGAYSGGMKQRLLVAQALLGDPKLIVLDEPTAGLDPKERVRLREQIAAAAHGRIVLFATHVVSDVQPIADKIIFLKCGHVVACDTVEALCAQYASDTLEDVYMKIFDASGEEPEEKGEHT